MTLNVADWIIVSLVLVSCLFGFKRGLIKEALSMANWAVALVVALSYREAMALLLTDMIQNPALRLTAAFAFLFTATLIVGALLNLIIGMLVRITGLTPMDRLFGLIFGLTRGAVVVMVILIAVSRVDKVERNDWWAQSVLIPPILSFEDWATKTGKVSVAWVMQFLSVG